MKLKAKNVTVGDIGIGTPLGYKCTKNIIDINCMKHSIIW